MIFRQYYLQCLSHASYLVGDETTGRAVVVDPQRDVRQYLDDAAAHGLAIERVIETHFHADFLSGHLELANATGAAISYGAAAEGAAFDVDLLAHGQRLVLGDVVLEVRSTPGHTPESISLVVYEHAGDTTPFGVLTGDTLFIGDVGRPDLLSSRGVTAEDLARRLYHSTRDELLTLPDETRVYPAHGAGSACGKQLSTETVSTIGEQRRTNYALRPMTEDQFVEAVTQGQSVAPLYFAFTADSNRRIHELLDDAEPEALPEPDDWLVCASWLIVEVELVMGAVWLAVAEPVDTLVSPEPMFTPAPTLAPAFTGELLMPTLASTPTFGLTFTPPEGEVVDALLEVESAGCGAVLPVAALGLEVPDALPEPEDWLVCALWSIVEDEPVMGALWVALAEPVDTLVSPVPTFTPAPTLAPAFTGELPIPTLASTPTFGFTFTPPEGDVVDPVVCDC